MTLYEKIIALYPELQPQDFLTKEESRGKRRQKTDRERRDRDVLDHKSAVAKKYFSMDDEQDFDDLTDIDPSFDWSRVR